MRNEEVDLTPLEVQPEQGNMATRLRSGGDHVL